MRAVSGAGGRMRLRVRFGSHRLEWTPTLGRGRCRRGPSAGTAQKLAVTSPRLAPGPVRTAWVKPTQRRLARYSAEEYCSLRFFAMLASFTFWLVILAVLELVKPTMRVVTTLSIC